MHYVVGDSHFAFINNRQILDCFLIANKVIHSLTNSRDGGVVLKVDFDKAYYSI